MKIWGLLQTAEVRQGSRHREPAAPLVHGDCNAFQQGEHLTARPLDDGGHTADLILQPRLPDDLQGFLDLVPESFAAQGAEGQLAGEPVFFGILTAHHNRFTSSHLNWVSVFSHLITHCQPGKEGFGQEHCRISRRHDTIAVDSGCAFGGGISLPWAGYADFGNRRKHHDI